MWKALWDGWVPPDIVDFDLYRSLRLNTPSALRGFVGFGCSFGAKWFGGYARSNNDKINHARASRDNVLKIIESLPRETQFSLKSYDQWNPQSGTVVYCDPPYANAGVGYKDTGKGFDHGAFWDRMDQWVENGAHVFVSEFVAPPHWVHIVESVQRLTIAGNSPVTKREQGLQYDRVWVPYKFRNGYPA